jgi:hypothetical protein
MSDMLTENGKRRKHDGCDIVLNICEPLHDVLTDLQSRPSLPGLNNDQGSGDSGKPVHENLSDIIQAFLNTYVRRLFPKQKESTSRWRDVCLRFQNFILICQDIPEAVTILSDNWAIASKTLIFSANWFLASANICRPMPFKLYEQLALLVTVPKRCEGRDPIRIPYQMKAEARKGVILFLLRVSFTIGRVINRTDLMSDDRAYLILDPKDLNFTKDDIAWSASEMKKDVANVCEHLEALHTAIRVWCLKVRDVKKEKLRLLEPELCIGQQSRDGWGIVEVRDFYDPPLEASLLFK